VYQPGDPIITAGQHRLQQREGDARQPLDRSLHFRAQIAFQFGDGPPLLSIRIGLLIDQASEAARSTAA